MLKFSQEDTSICNLIEFSKAFSSPVLYQCFILLVQVARKVQITKGQSFISGCTLPYHDPECPSVLCLPVMPTVPKGFGNKIFSVT